MNEFVSTDAWRRVRAFGHSAAAWAFGAATGSAQTLKVCLPVSSIEIA